MGSWLLWTSAKSAADITINLNKSDHASVWPQPVWQACVTPTSFFFSFFSTTYPAAPASSFTHSFTYSRLDLKINLPSSSLLYVSALVHHLRLETKWIDGGKKVIICELSVIQPNLVSLSSECWRHLCAKSRAYNETSEKEKHVLQPEPIESEWQFIITRIIICKCSKINFSQFCRTFFFFGTRDTRATVFGKNRLDAFQLAELQFNFCQFLQLRIKSNSFWTVFPSLDSYSMRYVERYDWQR